MKKQITKMLMFATVAGITTFTACKEDKKTDVSLPAIGGYNSSDDVASANLISKWSFDDNFNESKQNLAGFATNATLVAGKKGKAYQGAKGGFAAYNNAGTALPARKSTTRSPSPRTSSPGSTSPPSPPWRTRRRWSTAAALRTRSPNGPPDTRAS